MATMCLYPAALQMQNGDKVVYSKFAGTELKIAEDDFVILKVQPDEKQHLYCLLPLLICISCCGGVLMMKCCYRRRM